MTQSEPRANGARPFLLNDRHPASLRNAILDANDRCAWLLLTAPEGLRIERDAIAFSPGPLVSFDEAVQSAQGGDPPPLTADHASRDAVIRDPRPRDFAFRWSDDGESVAVLHRGEPIAMIVAGVGRGYSRALGKEGFYGHPWDPGVYETTFGV